MTQCKGRRASAPSPKVELHTINLPETLNLNNPYLRATQRRMPSNAGWVAIHPVIERVSGSQHMQLLCGCPSWAYWLAQYVWDLGLHILVRAVLTSHSITSRPRTAAK